MIFFPSIVTLVAIWFPIPKEPHDRLHQIQQAFAEANSKFERAYALAVPNQTSDGALKMAGAEFVRQRSVAFENALALAETAPKPDEAFAALEWILTTNSSYQTAAGKRAMEFATKHHAANPRIAKSIAWLGYYTPPKRAESYTAAIDLFHAVAKKNPDRTARGQAYLALAWQAQEKFREAEVTHSPEADKLATEAERAFEVVAKDYASSPRVMRKGQRTLGEEAEQELFELRHLRIGKVAPELEGKGLDGNPIKLSNYQGKVTVVVFWATWCSACTRLAPTERELAAMMKNKPVAIIGVNADSDRELANKAAAEMPIPWPSIWNGELAHDGPFSRAWNVREWPTIYVLDAKGVIRFKDTGPKNLVKTVEQLVKDLNR